MAWSPWSEWRRGGASRGGGGGRRNIISGVHDATGEEGEVLSPGGSVKDRTKASFVSRERYRGGGDGGGDNDVVISVCNVSLAAFVSVAHKQSTTHPCLFR